MKRISRFRAYRAGDSVFCCGRTRGQRGSAASHRRCGSFRRELLGGRADCAWSVFAVRPNVLEVPLRYRGRGGIGASTARTGVASA
jgi:hypothetical protein